MNRQISVIYSFSHYMYGIYCSHSEQRKLYPHHYHSYFLGGVCIRFIIIYSLAPLRNVEEIEILTFPPPLWISIKRFSAIDFFIVTYLNNTQLLDRFNHAEIPNKVLYKSKNFCSNFFSKFSMTDSVFFTLRLNWTLDEALPCWHILVNGIQDARDYSRLMKWFWVNYYWLFKFLLKSSYLDLLLDKNNSIQSNSFCYIHFEFQY